MTIDRSRPNVITGGPIVVAGSLFFFALCLISVLAGLDYLAPPRNQSATRHPDGEDTLAPDHVGAAKNDRLTSDPPIEPATNGLFDYTFTQIHMAMPVRITVWAKSEMQARSAGRAAFQRIHELVQTLSLYEPESELNRLVENGSSALSDRGQVVSPDLLAVLSYAQEIFQRTGGAVDPSAGPLIELWKKARSNKKLPPQPELDKALRRLGFQQIKIDRASGKVHVLRPDLQLDLGAIAKGYIADQALQVLRTRGIDSACIEAGGDFVVGDSPPGTSGWKIDVPDVGALRLENCGVSVSGDTVQFAEIDSIRYSHVVDPRTGKPLTNRIMAVVIAPSGMQSDALATSACILEESDFKTIVDGMEGVRGWRWRVGAKVSSRIIHDKIPVSELRPQLSDPHLLGPCF